MRKIKYIILTMCILITPIVIEAMPKVNYSISSNKKSYKVGESGTVNITLKGVNKGEATHDFKVTSNEYIKITGKSHFVETTNTSVSVTFVTTALGKGVVNISSGSGYDMNEGVEFTSGGSVSFDIVNPAPTPKPDPKPPVKDNTEEEKKGNTLSEEQKKKAEEERKKKELEAKKLIPLVKKAEITSESDKMKGKLLKTISFVNSEFDYEYTLPKNVNDVSINIPGVEGVSLDYEKNHSLAESDDQKVVSIKAKKGEIDQVLKIKLVKDTTPDITRNFESANASKSIQGLVVYHEPEVNKLLEGFGFKNLTEEIIGSYFSNDKMELQVLVDDSNTVNFYLLDNEKELETLVNPIVTSDDKLFFIDSSIREEDEIFGHKKSEITVEELFTLSDIDSSLKVNENVLGWELEEGLIVEGFTDNGTDAKFQIAENNDITKVIVPKVAPEPTDYVKIGLAVALTALAATNIIYFAVGYARKRKYDY